MPVRRFAQGQENNDTILDVQRVYNDNRTLDENISATDRSVVMVPEGYHPVGVPYGYKSYYLNVMAGPKRIWKFQ